MNGFEAFLKENPQHVVGWAVEKGLMEQERATAFLGYIADNIETREPCQWCNDTGRMDGPGEYEVVDCTHCKANSSKCEGCTNPDCPRCRADNDAGN